MTQTAQEIRMIGQKAMLLQKMTEAKINQGEEEEAVQYLAQLMDLADLIFEKSEEEKVDGLVVYINITSFINRTSSDLELNEAALLYSVLALRNSMYILANIESENPEALPEEVKCNFKTLQLVQINLIFEELIENTSYKNFMGQHVTLFAQFYSLYVKCMEELTMLVPDSPIYQMAKEQYEEINELAHYSYPYHTPSASNLYSFAETLYNELHNSELINKEDVEDEDERDDDEYDDDEYDDEEYDDEYGEFNLYEETYYDEWFDEFYKDMLCCNNDCLEKIFVQYSSAMDFTSPKTDIRACNVFVTEQFNWYDYPQNIFGQYQLLCEKYRLTPIDIPEFPLENRIPYVRPEDLLVIHRFTVMTFLHLKDHNICGSIELENKPTEEEILDFAGSHTMDMDFLSFLFMFVTFLLDIKSTYCDLAQLTLNHENYYLGCLDNGCFFEKGYFEQLAQAFEENLGPFTQRLKEMEVLPKNWTFKLNEIL